MHHPRIARVVAVGLACGALLATSALRAQEWPTKPIRLVVPFAPGGTSELVARTVGAELSKGLGQQVVIENKPGGASNVAMQEVARADADGYTLVLGHVGSMAVNPFMFAKLSYDVNRDFVPVSLWVKVPTIFVVHESVPVKTLAELVALAKKEPGKLFYGSAGNASAGHLAMEYLKLVTGMDIAHVPYKGTVPNVADLVAGRTHASAAGTPPFMPHVKSGKLRVLAVGTRERLDVLPDVPTVVEQGHAGFETSQWYGLVAPARTPDRVVARLAQESARATAVPAVRERFAVDNGIAVGSTPAEFAAFIATEQKRWSEVVRKAGIRAD